MYNASDSCIVGVSLKITLCSSLVVPLSGSCDPMIFYTVAVTLDKFLPLTWQQREEVFSWGVESFYGQKALRFPLLWGIHLCLAWAFLKLQLTIYWSTFFPLIVWLSIPNFMKIGSTAIQKKSINISEAKKGDGLGMKEGSFFGSSY